MDPIENYIDVNKIAWNQKVQTHFDSDFYDVEGFKKGKNVLTPIELPLLGDIQSKKILHLQCHFGMDSICLARMGAEVVGVDFSEEAIQTATQLANEENANARFICSDIYSLDQNLDEKFDIVFTTYGTIGWLEDLDQWAKIVSHFIKPGGKFIFAEFHPVVWMFSDQFDSIEFPYFKSDPIIENQTGTYANRDADISTQMISWNHSLGEVLSALLKNNIQIVDFQEYDYSPYNCLLNLEEFEPGKFRILHFENKIPMVYSIVGVRA